MKRKTNPKKLNNKGMAMVLVIVTIALVSLLVSVLFSISLSNYQMKVTEYQAKDSFYDAEKVLDQIHAGLQQVVSDATEVAYTRAMQQYKNSFYTEQQRLLEYRTAFANNVISILKANDDTHYYVGGKKDEFNGTIYTKGIVSFLDKNLAAKIQNEQLIVVCTISERSLLNTSEGVVLKGLQISYTDDDGYFTQVQTDINIGYPNISLNEASVLPNVFEYSIISDESVVFKNTVDTKVKDSIYAGSDGILFDNSSVSFENVNYLVTKGNITVNKSNKVIINGRNIWANGIEINGIVSTGSTATSSVLELDGNIFVADDLTTNNRNVSVKIDGEYNGYGGKIGNEQQSAMILNSANTKLDLSGLENLLLNGNAYINGGAINGEYAPKDELGNAIANSGDILIGTSIAMKTDQIVYLVPTEILGTTRDGFHMRSNPMTLSEYEEWSKNTSSDYRKLNSDKNINMLGVNLKNYGLDDLDFKTVFKTIGGETVCYVFLDFVDKDMAAKYYRDYISSARDRMEDYVSKYKNEILFDRNNTNFLAQGNLLTYSLNEEQLIIVENTITNNMSESEKNIILNNQENYIKTFNALCSKLTANYKGLTENELSKDIYYNLINTTKMKELTSIKTYASGTAVIYNNTGNVPYEVGSWSSNHQVKLLITSGDVVIKGSFSGLIIAEGKITVSEYTGNTIEGDKDAVTRLLQLELLEEDGKSLVETYFINGKQYAFDGIEGNSNLYVELESVITYANWKKQ